jgi:hypothetical protein
MEEGEIANEYKREGKVGCGGKSVVREEVEEENEWDMEE